MPNELIPTPSHNVTHPSALREVGQTANVHAQRGVFTDYLSRKAENTVRRQLADLLLFSAFLGEAGVPAPPTGEALQTEPLAWQGLTWGLVEAFRNWQLGQGYAVGSINVRLSTIKTYARLATKAGALAAQDLAMIKMVQGYSRKEGKRLDEQRDCTRTGHKKAEPVAITKEQADLLKAQPDTPQGRRDAVILSMLLDHGLRVGELAGLEVSTVNLKEGLFRFYREKVGKWQTHRLTVDSLRALRAWADSGDVPALGRLLRGSRKGGVLTEAGMSERAITERVCVLGEEIGVEGLRAHDCRHYWATRAARQGTDAFALQEAGGWASLAMPRRYVEASKVANERVKL